MEMTGELVHEISNYKNEIWDDNAKTVEDFDATQFHSLHIKHLSHLAVHESIKLF